MTLLHGVMTTAACSRSIDPENKRGYLLDLNQRVGF